MTQLAIAVDVAVAPEVVGTATVTLSYASDIIKDARGNALPSGELVAITIPLKVSFCSLLQCGAGVCVCLSYLPGYDPTPSPTGPDGNEFAQTEGGFPVAAVIGALAGVLLLTGAHLAHHKYRALRMRLKLQTTLAKVSRLGEILGSANADSKSAEAAAISLLQQAIALSSQHGGQPLHVVADELLALRDGAATDAKGGSPIDGSTGLPTTLWWTTLLRAAYEAHELRDGAKAPHDRRAIEVLTSWVNEVSDAPLQPGPGGGGGILLPPPPLMSPRPPKAHHVELPVSRPLGDATLLPQLTLAAAEGLRAQGPPLQEDESGPALLDLLRDRLDDYCVLPRSLGAALMSEFARWHAGQPGAAPLPPATEQQQVTCAPSQPCPPPCPRSIRALGTPYTCTLHMYMHPALAIHPIRIATRTRRAALALSPL